MTRDMSQKEFRAACDRHGFKPEGFMGYYRLAGPQHCCVSLWNCAPNRRAQLAYLIREQAKNDAKRDA